MKCDYLNCFWIAFKWWIAFNLMKCDCLNYFIKNTYVAWQVENKHLSFVCSRLDNQTLTMKWSNKITRTNRYKQFLYEKICIVFLKSDLTRSKMNRYKRILHEKICIVFFKSHFTSRQNAKYIIKYILATNCFINIHRNNESFR